MAKKKTSPRFSFFVSIVVALGALGFFAFAYKKDRSAPEPQPAVSETAVLHEAPAQVDNAAMEQQAGRVVAPRIRPEDIPADLPEDLRQSLLKPPPELPEDLKAQLNAPPPELPEDLKKQLKNQPTELPPDLKAQLNAPPPELPDDIKQALKIPPRVVTIEEVNTPPDPGY